MPIRALAASLALGLLSTGAIAHEVGISVVYLRVLNDAVEGRVDIFPVDLQRVLNLGIPEDRELTYADVLPHAPRIRAFLDEHLSISSNEGAHRVRWTGIRPTEGGEPAGFLSMEFVLEGVTQQPSVFEVTYDALLDEVDDHVAVLALEQHWGSGTFGNESEISGTFTRGDPTVTLDLSESSWWRGFSGMVGLGMHHIWIGIDHVLFLVALLLPSVLRRREDEWVPLARFRPAFWNVVKVVTLFTIAHSVTLSLAALEIVNLPSRLVESIIALSIALAALHNLYPRFIGKEWLIVFGFGLFHGFGFASVMGDYQLGGDNLVAALFGFNVGVEIGQIVVIAAIFPVLYLLRKTALYPSILRYGSWLLVAISMMWFVERAFDLPISQWIGAKWRAGLSRLGLT